MENLTNLSIMKYVQSCGNIYINMQMQNAHEGLGELLLSLGYQMLHKNIHSFSTVTMKYTEAQQPHKFKLYNTLNYLRMQRMFQI